MSDRKRPRNKDVRRGARSVFNGLNIVRDVQNVHDVRAIRAGVITADRACDGKIRYSRKFAERAAAAMRRDKRDNRFHSYPCAFCGSFHVGKNPVPVV